MSEDVREEILELVRLAYGTDLADLYHALGPGTHVLGRVNGELVTHAMWVTRWLQPSGEAPRMTAYVELVATRPLEQRRRYASVVLERLVCEIPERYELAALCPATPGIYERLGWRFWQGPLSIRLPDGQSRSTPEERIMVRELPGRAPIDLNAPLSAEWRAGEVW